MQIVLPVVFNSRATTSLQAIQLFKSLVCLLIDSEQPSYTSSNSLIAVSEDDGRAQIGGENKQHRQKRNV